MPTESLIAEVYDLFRVYAIASSAACPTLALRGSPEDLAHAAVEVFLRRGLFGSYRREKGAVSTYFGLAWQRWISNERQKAAREAARRQPSSACEDFPASLSEYSPENLDALEELLVAAVAGSPIFPEGRTLATLYGEHPLSEVTVVLALAAGYTAVEIGAQTTPPLSSWPRCIRELRKRVRGIF